LHLKSFAAMPSIPPAVHPPCCASPAVHLMLTLTFLHRSTQAEKKEKKKRRKESMGSV